MQVDDLMKICLSIGVMSSKVIPDQYVVSPEEVARSKDRPTGIQSTKADEHANPAAIGAMETNP